MHSDACYAWHDILICEKPVLPVHIHDDGCFRIEEITTVEAEEDAAAQEAMEEPAEGETFLAFEEVPEEESMEYPADEMALAEFTGEEGEESAEDPIPEEDPAAEAAAVEEDEHADYSVEVTEKITEAVTEDGTSDELTGSDHDDPAETESSDETPVEEDTQETGEEVSEYAQEAGEEVGEDPQETAEKNQEDTAEVAEEAPVSAMPAQTFFGETGELIITVEAPEGAFPEGTTMTVVPVQQEEVIDALHEAVTDVMIRNVQAVDISFRDPDGNEIEPETAIFVKMSKKLPTTEATAENGEEKESVLMHIDSKGGASPVENAAVEENSAAFEADSFSVYVMMDLVKKDYLASDGNTYTITMTYGADAGIPEGAELLVREIEPTADMEGSDSAQAEEAAPEYDELVEKTQAALKKNEKVTFARFFDICILVNSEEIRPLAPVSVKIELTDELTEDVRAVHFAHTSEETDETEAVLLDATLAEAQSMENAVSFETGGFSIYGVVLMETISTDYLSSDGITFRIELSLDERDAIDGVAELVVQEITEGGAEYERYMASASETLGLQTTDDISFARFFDITILKDGEKYEPQYPVQVKITYPEAVDLSDGKQLSIVHFADQGPEVIRDVEIGDNATELVYEQTGFSVTGTVVAQNSIQDGKQYIIYARTGSNGSDYHYYAISHYSEGRDKDLVYGIEIDGSSTTGQTVSTEEYGSSIVWTVHTVNIGGETYYTFSYEEDGKTYYLRTYGGLMVGADSDIDEAAYREAGRYQWRYSSNRLRSYHNRNNGEYFLRYSASNLAFRERDMNASSNFYFALVKDYTQDVVKTPTVHYVDESGNELTIENGRDWTADAATSPAFLMYDIDGYDYVKSSIGAVDETEIRPILRNFAGKW